MEIKQFIEKAIEGGWNPTEKHCVSKTEITGFEVKGNTVYLNTPSELNPRAYLNLRIEEIILDPKAWKAVGKVEGWDEKYFQKYMVQNYQGCANMKMHQMIDALCEGKSIEDFITTL